MDRASDYVTALIFDGETCHQLIKQCVHGNLDRVSRLKLAELVYFKDVQYSEIPGTDLLPRCPMKICKVKGQPLFAITGPAHSVKNAASQLMSATKVLYYGNFAADPTPMLEHDLPLPAYVRKDAMSDRFAVLLTEETSTSVSIADNMKGMLLWNITSALCVAPLVHSKMTLEDRAECAISGFVLQDLWSMIATQREKSFRMQSLTQKAIAAAIHLVSRCSDYPVQKLEQMYHVQCASAAFDDMEKEGEDEQLENGGDQEHEAEDADAVKPILDEIMKVAAEETADNNKESEENEPADRDPDCALPDSEELIALTSSCPEPANNAVLDGAKTFPKNLREAVADSQGLWIGNVVVLNRAHGEPLVAALILTLWPHGKKPNPCAQEDVTGKKILLSSESVEAFARLSAQDFEEPVENKKRKSETQQVTFAHAKAQLKRAGRIGTSKKKVLQELDVQACDIKRSDAGRKAIRRILLRVAELDLVHWTCTLKKCSEITWDNFIKNIPFFFQFKYFGLRNSHQYGQRVGSDLQAIMKALKAKPPNRKPYQSLIQEFVESKVGGHEAQLQAEAALEALKREHEEVLRARDAEHEKQRRHLESLQENGGVVQLAERVQNSPCERLDEPRVSIFEFSRGVALLLFIVGQAEEQCLLQTRAGPSELPAHVGPTRIPCIIHQTWKKHQLLGKQHRWVGSWKSLNPSCEHRLWNDTEIALLAKTKSPKVIWPIWDGLTPIEKTDVFRYLVLYEYGGYYSDIDVTSMKPIAEYPVPKDASMIVGYEFGHRFPEDARIENTLARTEQFEQWFLASAPKSPMLKRCLEMIREKFRWKIQSTLDLTGPGTFSDAVHEFLEDHSPHEAVLKEISFRQSQVSYQKGWHYLSYPSERMYGTGDWKIWLLAAGRVNAVPRIKEEDPDEALEPLLVHHFIGTWKPAHGISHH
ncbi:unnamed protein product [Durusdinium trenchii]|uniref:Alpha 1,4-glycosyltransferase domain-containing protein n=1 Tax=Durusdinium trenchii TaxID=1381693 RepID=A0ABP0K8K5_9DINO